MSGNPTGETARFAAGAADSAAGPGTLARVLLFAASLVGFTARVRRRVSSPARPIAFPSCSSRRSSRSRPRRSGIEVCASSRSCSSRARDCSRASDRRKRPAAWPTLLFAGLAAGWTFRFIYDFETRAGSLRRRPRPASAARRLDALDAARRSSQARSSGRCCTGFRPAGRQRRRTPRRGGDSRQPSRFRRARLRRRVLSPAAALGRRDPATDALGAGLVGAGIARARGHGAATRVCCRRSGALTGD